MNLNSIPCLHVRLWVHAPLTKCNITAIFEEEMGSGKTLEQSWTLKLLVKSNHKKSIEEMFNSESQSISTRTVWRELKRLRLNSCVAWRKTLSEHNDWTLEQRREVMWSRFTLFQCDGRTGVRREAGLSWLCILPCLIRCICLFHVWAHLHGFTPRYQKASAFSFSRNSCFFVNRWALDHLAVL